MAKRLVICCDGTWNTLRQPAPTNVGQLQRVVAPADRAGREQRVYYREGVGTGKLWDHVTGGAFGVGLSANVRDAYRFVAENYEPGDELFFFGFSRGAYTARSTVGLIRNCGVLRPGEIDRLDQAYRLYRARDRATSAPESPQAREFRAKYAHEDRTPIRFVGVWDTVGALGIPLSGGRLIHLLNKRWQFHDTELTSIVQAAFQALAVDEHRKSFRPAVWAPAKAANGQVREQVWFAGAHSDVGGGYRQPALSDLALRWMADQAEQCGLAFEDNAFAYLAARDELGELHVSLNAFFRWFGSANRTIGRVDPATEFAGSCALNRRDQMRPPYRPGNLLTYLADPAHRIMKI
ncbi:DUF2235 domain-containing protein [Amycolatopsis rifamycinica]|uniref:T6SS Phospholipase effector Tle1-like catalytic domain-containing protein n=1 Tax=Amycolatopsis rifamycinica TaxID=287986 RepID=A0A066U5F4_9PSEU|nr:DUF2235 domain-containing protein [Amycolatopsis rifamycinica]KDN22320.1 hypothetical protein DV20_10425 [Amycolatopsis rifamycinica]